MQAKLIQQKTESIVGRSRSWRSRHARRAVFVAVLTVCAVNSTAMAATYSWNAFSGDWSIASNWSSSAVPNSSAVAVIANGGTTAITLNSETCYSLYLGDLSSANAGAVQMSSGGLYANNGEYFGNSGAGTFNQIGGTNSFGSSLYLGYGPSSSGAYNLSGTGAVSGTTVYLGYAGTGSFNQSGGRNTISNLYAGNNAGSSGSYVLGGSGYLSASAEYLGYSDAGSFTQSGGTNTVGSYNLYLGYNATGSGSYLLGPGTLNAPAEYLGYSGTGSFNQSAGTNAATYLYLGNNAGASGSYVLGGSGYLSATAEFLGYSAAGSFTQSGGTNSLRGSSYLYLGYGTNATGSYNLNGPGALSAYIEYVGYSGAGTFTQSGGTNNATGSGLYLGLNARANGSYNLSDSGAVSANSAYLGYSGTGSFAQSGGTSNLGNLYLGYNAGSSGNYNLSAGLLSGNSGIIGYSGTGSFTQSGGTNNLGNGYLYLGYNSGSSGSYDLNGPGTLNASIEYLGYYGAATLTQSAGTNSVGNGTIHLGYLSGSRGTLSLSGSGFVSAGNELVGSSGTGVVYQSGGTNSIAAGGSLRIGSNTSYGAGIYTLSGSGVLSAPNEYIGMAVTGSFVQTGGLNSTSFLSIGGLGRYQFSSGTLQLGGLSNSQGTLDATGSLGVLNISAGQLVDLTRATLVNTGSMSMNIGSDALVLFPANFNPATALGSYSNQGQAHLPGSPVTISAGQAYAGSITLSDLLICQGTLSPLAGGSITLNGGVILSGTGSVRLNNGMLAVSDSQSSVSGGSLSAYSGYVGSSGPGLLAQSGGTANFANFASGYLYVGYGTSYSGTYSLSGSGVLVTPSETIGGSRQGLFLQTGGLNSVTALNIGSLGRYQFSGGTLQLGGLSNQGVFDATQSTGLLALGSGQIADLTQAILVNTASMSLSAGTGSLLLVPSSFSPSAFASYNNQGLLHYPGTPLTISSSQAYTSVFSLNDMFICQGTIAASSGGSIYLNGGVAVSGSGRVNLGNGTFIADNAASSITGGSLGALTGYVGYAGSGTFTQTDGTNVVGNYNGGLYLGYNAAAKGTYNLSGTATLSAYPQYVGYNGAGAFNQSGGWNSANYGSVYLGYNAGSSGVYNLTDGMLSGPEYVGNYGSGTLNQTGGTNNAGSLYIGNNAGSSGVYNLTSGSLAGSEYVGNSGSGTLNQSGGINNIGAYGSLNIGNSGAYILSGWGQLSGNENVSGVLNQTGGVNNAGSLYVGYNSGVNGSYLLSNSGFVTANAEYVGSSGSGTFTQTGGSNATSYLTIGSQGRYQFRSGSLHVGSFANQGIFDATSSSGSLAIDGSSIVDFSQAVLVNTGLMSLNIGPNSLFLLPAGFNPAGKFKNYSNQGLTHNVGTPLTILPGQGFGGAGSIGDFVSCQGTISAVNGSINLNGGIAISGTANVYLGSGSVTNDAAGSMSGGTLQASLLYVGSAASGTFVQSGGLNSVSDLYVGYQAGSSGSYTLSGSGVLSSYFESIGVNGSGTFVQTGGSNSLSTLSIGSHGRYQFSGGTLKIASQGIPSQGIFDATNSTGVLNVGGNAAVDFSHAILVNTGSMSVSIGPNSLLLVPAGFDPTTAFASFSNLGLTHNVGTTLTILPGQGFSGNVTLTDFVNCQGKIAPNGTVNLNNGVAISGTGSVSLGSGQLVVNDTISGISGGALSAGAEYVGNTATGAFVQSGGTNSLSNYSGSLYVGYNAGVSGSYSLGGSAVLNAATEYVGYSGAGTFTQSGGSNAARLILGYNAGATGSYNLSGASGLSANSEIVGYNGTGAIVQSGGSNAVGSGYNGGLYLGYYGSSSSGSYSLSGPAMLSAGAEYVGYSGAGTFIQSGGTNAASGRLYLGYYGSGYNSNGYNGPSSGSYVLSGSALLSAAGEFVGYYGAGTFVQSGGTNIVSGAGNGLSIGCNGGSGSYSLSGPSMLSAANEYVGNYGSTGSFAQSGGTNTISGGLYLNSAASYVLSGLSVLSASAEYVGNPGGASMVQTGGLNSTSLLSIGSQSRYQFSGGTLQVTGPGLAIQGGFDATQSTGVFTVAGSAIVDLSQAVLVNTGSMTLGVGPNSLLLLPAGFDPTAAFARYSNQGMTHNVGSPLNVLSGQGFAGTGTIGDFVSCQGTILATGGSINLNGGLAVSGTGIVNLGGGAFFVSTSLSGISSGVLSASAGYVDSTGGTASGLFTQTGGTSNLGSLYLGHSSPSSSGGYSLGGSGTLVASNEYVGGPGTGTFVQTGGLNIATDLSIGGLGRYQFSGGTLVLNGLTNQGVFDATQSTGVLSITGSQIADLSQAVLVNTGSMSLSVGPGSLLFVSAGFNPAGFGSYSNQGATHVAGTPLAIAAGQAFSGAFNLNDPFSCQGSLSALSGGSINLNGGVAISGTGNVDLGGGAYIVDNAASSISGGTLNASHGYVGYAGTGTFAQVGGTNANLYDFNGGLYLGYNATANGTYNLSGAATLSPYTEYVGYSGIGTLNQSGGTNNAGSLYLGSSASASGVYNLNAGLLSGTEYVGNSGSGTLNQFGGTNNPGTLYVGSNTGSRGVYFLSGSGQLSGTEYVGNSGSGTLIQSGGTNSPSSLYLGYSAGGSGAYILSGSGLLSVGSNGYEYLGYSGTGQVIQSGGTNNCASALCLGFNSGSSGSYTLSGSGVLASSAENVGYSLGSGVFSQSGGSNSAGNLSIGASSRYQFSGGTLQVGSLSNQGAFDATGSLGVLAIGGSAIADLSQATLVNVGSMSLSVGPNSLLLLPAGFNPATALRSYSNQGLTHNVGTPLAVLPGQGFAGSGTIGDLVDCQGTIAAVNGSITLNGGLSLSGTARVNLGGGTVVDNTAASISGGTLQAGSEWIGDVGAGTLTQSGGSNTVSNLYLGTSLGSSGTYCLGGSGTIAAFNEAIGNGGAGTFLQSGGRNVVQSFAIGSLGRYQFSGGTFQVTSTGMPNQGIFDATGSTGLLMTTGGQVVDLSLATFNNTGSMSMSIGPNSLVLLPAGFDPATALGSFINQGTTHNIGTPLTISSTQSFFGSFSSGDFVNCQGTLTTNYKINLNNGVAVSGIGSVNLGNGQLSVNDTVSGISGGSLAAMAEYVGNTANGAFAQTGGSNIIGGKYVPSYAALYLGYNAGVSGSYSLSGPAILSMPNQYVGYSGTGVFTQTGGTNAYNYYPYYYNSQLVLGNGTGACGCYNLSGTGTVGFDSECIGNSGTGTFTQSGGTNSVGVKSSGSLYLAYFAGSSGSYNLAGSGSLAAGTEFVGFGGVGTFNQSGGTNVVSNIYLGTNGGSGTYNLNGGLLAVTRLGGKSDGSAFNFGGGTLQARFGFSTSMPMTFSSSDVATFDTAGYTATLSGSLSGPGGLVKIGNGVLLLTASDTFSGPTTVSQGKFVVNGSLVSAITVNSGGILAGTGSLTSVKVTAGGHLSPGNSPGTLSLSGSLTLLPGAAMDFDLDSLQGSDEIYMPNGLLVLSGQQFSDFNFTPLAGFGPGEYTLIDADLVTGGLGSSASGMIDGLPATLAIQGNDLVLTVVPEPGTLALLAAGILMQFTLSAKRKRGND